MDLYLYRYFYFTVGQLDHEIEISIGESTPTSVSNLIRSKSFFKNSFFYHWLLNYIFWNCILEWYFKLVLVVGQENAWLNVNSQTLLPSSLQGVFANTKFIFELASSGFWTVALPIELSSLIRFKRTKYFRVDLTLVFEELSSKIFCAPKLDKTRSHPQLAR